MIPKKIEFRGNYWISAPNWERLLALLVVDALLIAVALNFSFLLRFGWPIPDEFILHHYKPLALVYFPIRLGCFWFFGLYNWSFRYASIHDMIRIISSVALGSFIFLLLRTVNFFEASLMILFNEAVMTTFFIGGIRLSGRVIQVLSHKHDPAGNRSILAGRYDQVELLLREFMRNLGQAHRAVAIVDSSGRRAGQKLHGVRVISPQEIPAVVQREGANTLILAGQVLGEDLRAITDLCRTHSLQFRRVPMLTGVEEGHQLTLKKVNPEDLLARQPFRFDTLLLKNQFHGRKILVTGAAGSIGAELCRQLAAFEPDRLILLDFNENELYLRERELEQVFPALHIVAEFCDLKNRPALAKSFARHKPDIIFHAAAHKHVPMMEKFPGDCVINNVGGFIHVSELAIEHGAERVIYISTDKAVQPTSVMGFTKRLGELLALAYARNQSATKFMGVRFGNVLGSNGSVIPIFLQQIEAGGPVTVTHPEMTRFFMTIPEAVQLVIQAGGLGGSGEIFVLDMGKP
ncbi:MAG: polysaccharide biosynthesis protein, partial [Verrucomicrobiae bacterium]|nr:polysaccharide biosynthesis protein [Verrucomicrobiae bacterium]